MKPLFRIQNKHSRTCPQPQIPFRIFQQRINTNITQLRIGNGIYHVCFPGFDVIEPHTVIPSGKTQFICPFTINNIIDRRCISHILQYRMRAVRNNGMLFHIIKYQTESHDSHPQIPIILLIDTADRAGRAMLTQSLQRIIIKPELICIYSTNTSPQHTQPHQPVFTAQQRVHLIKR